VCLEVGALLLLLAMSQSGCATVAPKNSQQPPPNQAVAITVSPSSSTLLLGNSATFTASVTNTTDTAVTWSVNGNAGGNSALGTINANGVYTAPADLPSSAIKVTATSHADSTKSASAAITVQSDIVVALSSTSAAVELGAPRAFSATISSAAHPDPSVTWSLSGPACPLACGTVDASGDYTAPQILPPQPASIVLTARSVADPSKQASAAITVTSNFQLQLTVPSAVAAAASATFVATLKPVPGSNPSTALSWNLSGAACTGISCGTLSVVTTQLAGGNSDVFSANYTAPPASPTPDSIVVTVIPQADASKAAQQTFTIQSGAGSGNLTVSPATATRAINHRVTLTAQFNGISNNGITWSVNGGPGGSATFGTICAVNSNPCQPLTNPNATQVDYLAPAFVPNPNPVTVEAATTADSTKNATAQITIINHDAVSILPSSVALAPAQMQQFTATVTGATNQNVVWQIQGSACSAGAFACGAITPAGIYTAPGAAPSPDAIQIVAISSDDTAQSATANVSVTTGVNILTLHPASVYAGAADGFTLLVSGSGFTPTVTGASSTLIVAGTARTTTCSATDACTATVTAADVAVPGSVTVQIQNPNGTKSNVVELIAAQPNISDEVIALTAGAPTASGKDIVVVDPTTAGVSATGNDVDLNVAALGIFDVASNTCTLGGNPLTLTHNSSTAATADICAFSESGLDASMTYTISGPGDIQVIAKTPIGLGIIRITLQISATAAAPSARTVFIQNTNLDKTAATGTLWLQ
jgi:hypothetical protein